MCELSLRQDHLSRVTTAQNKYTDLIMTHSFENNDLGPFLAAKSSSIWLSVCLEIIAVTFDARL